MTPPTMLTDESSFANDEQTLDELRASRPRVRRRRIMSLRAVALGLGAVSILPAVAVSLDREQR